MECEAQSRKYLIESLTKLRAELGTANALNISHSSTIKSLSERRNDLLDQAQKNKEQLDLTEKSLETAESTLSKNSIELDGLQAQLQKAQKSGKVKEEENEKLRDQIQGHLNIIECKTRTIGQMAREKEAMGRSLDQHNNTANLLRQRLEDQHDYYNSVELDCLRREERLNSKLQGVWNTVCLMDAELDQKDGDVKRGKARIKEMEEELRISKQTMKRQREVADGKIAVLETSLTIKRSKIESLEQNTENALIEKTAKASETTALVEQLKAEQEKSRNSVKQYEASAKKQEDGLKASLKSHEDLRRSAVDGIVSSLSMKFGHLCRERCTLQNVAELMLMSSAASTRLMVAEVVTKPWSLLPRGQGYTLEKRIELEKLALREAAILLYILVTEGQVSTSDPFVLIIHIQNSLATSKDELLPWLIAACCTYYLKVPKPVEAELGLLGIALDLLLAHSIQRFPDFWEKSEQVADDALELLGYIDSCHTQFESLRRIAEAGVDDGLDLLGSEIGDRLMRLSKGGGLVTDKASAYIFVFQPGGEILLASKLLFYQDDARENPDPWTTVFMVLKGGHDDYKDRTFRIRGVWNIVWYCDHAQPGLANTGPDIEITRRIRAGEGKAVLDELGIP